jgi:hypothetical protein
VQIQGVRNVPELPFDTFTLAGATAAAIAAAMRFKAAFKISSHAQSPVNIALNV